LKRAFLKDVFIVSPKVEEELPLKQGLKPDRGNGFRFRMAELKRNFH